MERQEQAFYKCTGILLKRARKAALLSQIVASGKVNKSKSWLSDIETGKNAIYFSDLIELLKLYEVDINEFSSNVLDMMEDEI